MSEKKILDASCGARMFWFDKHHPNAIYMDNRQVDNELLCDGRRLTVAPDVVADFRHMPFADNSFWLVVWDPPHLVRVGDKSWTAKKYGKLTKSWQDDLRQGFAECFRVLRPNGTLIFKWSEDQIRIADVLALTDEKPLFGNRSGKTTHWIAFMKEVQP